MSDELRQQGLHEGDPLTPSAELIPTVQALGTPSTPSAEPIPSTVQALGTPPGLRRRHRIVGRST